MKPDYREMVKTMTNAIIANKSYPHAVGTLEALLWMALEEMPADKVGQFENLIKITTQEQG